jgi:hypothetical protein
MEARSVCCRVQGDWQPADSSCCAGVLRGGIAGGRHQRHQRLTRCTAASQPLLPSHVVKGPTSPAPAVAGLSAAAKQRRMSRSYRGHALHMPGGSHSTGAQRMPYQQLPCPNLKQFWQSGMRVIMTASTIALKNSYRDAPPLHCYHSR